MNNRIVYEYMVEIDLPVPFNQEFISLIPKQRELINNLMKDKIITSYAVSIEDGKLWTTMLAESEDDIVDILITFPIIDQIEYKISKLAFHNIISTIIPQFSLN